MISLRFLRELSSSGLSVRLRSDAGQWQVCLTGDSDWFDNAPAASLYNGFPRIGTMLTASRYQNQIIRWLLRPLPGDMSDFWLLTARELSVLKILMQGMSFSEIARCEQTQFKDPARDCHTGINETLTGNSERFQAALYGMR